jgi:hypothetical protein
MPSPKEFTLASVDSLIVLSFQDPALGLWILNESGEIVAKSVPSHSLLQSERIPTEVRIQKNTAKWFAMPVVPVGNELVQTIVNPITGERVLLALNRKGELVRSSRLTGLISLTASDEGRKIVVGARIPSKPEIVVCRARWYVAHQPTKEVK